MIMGTLYLDILLVKFERSTYSFRLREGEAVHLTVHVVSGRGYSKENRSLISNFRRVLNVLCFLLGDSPVSEFYMSTFRNTLIHLRRQVGACRMN